MSYCTRCGVQLPEGVPACLRCSASRPGPIPRPVVSDQPGGGTALLSFFIPVVGFALWYAWRQQSPLRARSARRGALIGTVAGAVVYVAASVIYLAVIAAAMRKLS